MVLSELKDVPFTVSFTDSLFWRQLKGAKLSFFSERSESCSGSCQCLAGGCFDHCHLNAHISPVCHGVLGCTKGLTQIMGSPLGDIEEDQRLTGYSQDRRRHGSHRSDSTSNLLSQPRRV